MMGLNRQKIIIVNYGMGNLGYIHNMLKYIGHEAFISADTDEIMSADKLILSGVGAFDGGMKNLNEGGFLFPLEKKVLDDKIPILGICLGMQLFSKRSEEGRLPGLGWLNAETVRFSFGDNAGSLKIPHMGWNTMTVEKNDPLFSRKKKMTPFAAECPTIFASILSIPSICCVPMKKTSSAALSTAINLPPP